MNTTFLILLATIPGIGIALYVYSLDKNEPEPIRLLIISFLLGIISLGFDLLFAIPLEEYFTIHENNLKEEAFHAFVIVAFLEELSKFIIIRGVLYSNKNFNEPLDGIVYAVMVGMGFATAENIIYALESGGGVAILRMFTAIPAHALFAVMMGFMLGKAKFTHKKEMSIGLAALAIATLFHGVYDYFLFISFIPGIWIGSAIALVIGFILSKRAVQFHLKASPFIQNRNGDMP